MQHASCEFKIELIGDGPYRAELVKLADELGVRHKIHFAGSVPYSDLPQKYHEADIFTLCSSAEGMPLVVLEAMGCGLPVAASRVQGIEDLVEVGVNGTLFPPGDVGELAQGLISLINDGNSRIKMGKASIARVQKYDWKNIAQSYLKIYQRILRSK